MTLISNILFKIRYLYVHITRDQDLDWYREQHRIRKQMSMNYDNNTHRSSLIFEEQYKMLHDMEKNELKEQLKQNKRIQQLKLHNNNNNTSFDEEDI